MAKTDKAIRELLEYTARLYNEYLTEYVKEKYQYEFYVDRANAIYKVLDKAKELELVKNISKDRSKVNAYWYRPIQLQFEDDPNDESADRNEIIAAAEKDGRLVVLPCKVGDTVWFVSQVFDGEKVVDKVAHRVIDGIGGNRLNPIWLVSKEPYEVRFHPSEFGKTVFLTREEAEAALQKEKQGGTENDEFRILERQA